MRLDLRDAGRFFVQAVWDEGAEGSIAVGNEVITVDGLTLHGMSLEEASDVLEGPAGSLVDLLIRLEVIPPPSLRVGVWGALVCGGGGVTIVYG